MPSCPPVSRGRKSKSEKVGRIRTSRNSQKVYHNILKHWLSHHQLEPLANKYSKYFNQRIYFVLALHEIVKAEEGQRFLEDYQGQANEVCKRKEAEILMIQREKSSC